MSELRYEIRGYSEDILLDENDEYITAQDRISELEKQVAELKRENEHMKQCAELANDMSDYNNRRV